MRIARDIPGASIIEGYVVTVGSSWVLLANVPSTRLDGFVAIRLRDVARVQPHQSHGFYKTVAEANGSWPPALPTTLIDLDATGRLVQTAHAHGTIVNLQVEYDDPDVSFLGVPTEIDERSVVLQEVTPQAVWDGTVSRWRHGEISRVEFSGAYEADLFLVAGPPPAG